MIRVVWEWLRLTWLDQQRWKGCQLCLTHDAPCVVVVVISGKLYRKNLCETCLLRHQYGIDAYVGIRQALQDRAITGRDDGSPVPQGAANDVVHSDRLT